jgi:hypothetical protein
MQSVSIDPQMYLRLTFASNKRLEAFEGRCGSQWPAAPPATHRFGARYFDFA